MNILPTYERLNLYSRHLGYSVPKAIEVYGSANEIISKSPVSISHFTKTKDMVTTEQKFKDLLGEIKPFIGSNPTFNTIIENSKVDVSPVSELNDYAKLRYIKHTALLSEYQVTEDKQKIKMRDSAENKLNGLLELNNKILENPENYVDLGKYYIDNEGNLYSIFSGEKLTPSHSKGHDSHRFYTTKISQNKLVYWAFNGIENNNIFELPYVIKKDLTKPATLKNLIIKYNE